MHISWHGEFTIKIQSEDTIVLIDPFSGANGLSPLRTPAKIIALTNPANEAMSHLSARNDETIIIDSPGEYDISGCGLHALGWHASDGTERSLQRWNIEDITLLHVGALNRDLTAEELQQLEKVAIDVLFVPVGGGESLTVKQAMNLITTIEPRMVIPINYHIPGLTTKVEGLDHFAKEMGLGSITTEKKVIIKANKLPTEDMATILLAP